jgi:hypothetical protein
LALTALIVCFVGYLAVTGKDVQDERVVSLADDLREEATGA